MITIAICDDDKFYTDKVCDLIRREGLDCKTHTFSSGKEFLTSPSRYDILFMDIELPDANGIKLLQNNHYDSLVILMTSHDEEVLNGYYIRAFRFLLKPIQETLFHEALSSALDELRKTVSIEVTGENNTIRKLPLKDIVYAEAGDKKTGIRTFTSFYYANMPINQLYQNLNPDFYFVHRSYIINMNYISQLDVKKRTAIMQEESLISVSRLKWKDFRETFYLFLKNKMNGAR